MQRAMQRITTFFFLLTLSLWTVLANAAAITSHRGGVNAARHVVARRSSTMERRDVAADFASQFPSTQDLHLFSTSISGLSSSPLLILSNTTHALFSLNVSSSLSSDMGWIALGLGGSTMASTHQMAIAIPSSAAPGGWALSNRAATGHVMPKAVSAAQAAPASLVASLSQAPSLMTFIVPFTRSSDPTKQGLNMVFAYSSSKVTLSGSADDATIAMHDSGNFGSFVADLSKSAVVNSDGTLAAGSQPSKAASGGMTKYQKVIMWHAILGAAAWMLIAPTAVLVGRLGRNWGNWMKTHRALQAGLTVTLTLVAVILAVAAIKSNGGSFTAGGHQLLGFLILIGVLIQASLGQYAHAKLDRNRTKRPGRNVTHIFLGVTLLIAGWVQVYLGLRLYNRVVPGGLPSANNLYVVWAVFVVVPVVLYVLSCIFLVHERRRKQGMSMSMAAFGLGRDGGTVPASARLQDSEKSWPPYVADFSAAKDDENEKGFFGRMFSFGRRGRRDSLSEVDGKVSPFAVYERDIYGNPIKRDDGYGGQDERHLSWGNNGRSELDAFNQQALQRGFAMAVDAQPAGTPIATQYTTGYGYAQSTNYAVDANAERERSGGMRELALRPGLTSDPTAAYRTGSQPTRPYHVATSPETTGRTFRTAGSPEDRSRVLYAGPSAYTGGHPNHNRGQESVSGQSDVSGHSAGSSGSRRALVQGGGYYNQGQRF